MLHLAPSMRSKGVVHPVKRIFTGKLFKIARIKGKAKSENSSPNTKYMGKTGIIGIYTECIKSRRIFQRAFYIFLLLVLKKACSMNTAAKQFEEISGKSQTAFSTAGRPEEKGGERKKLWSRPLFGLKI